MKKLLFVSLLSATALIAGISAAASAWSSWGSITSIKEYGTGLEVKGPNFAANPSNCYESNFATVDHTLPDEEIDRLNKVILAAMLGGRDIRVYMKDSGCRNSNPIFTRVEMR